MPPWLLRLMTGLGRAFPQGQQAAPGGDTKPRANHRPRVDDGHDPAEVRCMQPLEGVDLEGHSIARRPPRGVEYHAEEEHFRFRFSISGIALGSGKSQPLRPLCSPLSRYRRNRLPLLCSEGTANHTTPMSLRTWAVARSIPLLLPQLGHGAPVAWSWRLHSRQRRRHLLRSPRHRFSQRQKLDWTS